MQQQLVAALRNLRARAGLGESLAEEDAVAQVVALRQEKEAVAAELQRVRGALTELRSAGDEASEAEKCAICDSNSADTAVVPCGHMMCGGCVDQLRRPTCPFCRKAIASRVKLFNPRS